MNSKYRIPVVALTYIILGAVMGALTNAINVQLSPTFFRLVFHWQDVVRIQPAAIGLGTLIGLGCGLLFAFVFTGIVGIVTRGDFRFERALRFILVYSLLAPAGYVCGGLLGIGAGALIPAFFQGPFLPSELSGSTETIKFAGVLWATWGMMGGGFSGMILASIAFIDYSRNRPRRGVRAVLAAGFSAVMKLSEEARTSARTIHKDWHLWGQESSVTPSPVHAMDQSIKTTQPLRNKTVKGIDMKNRMLAEILALLGFFVIVPSISHPSAAALFILPGGGMIAVGAWLRNRSGGREVTGGGEETEAGSSAQEPKWPRWLVSVCAGLIVLRFLPSLPHMAGEEHNILLVFIILPSAAVMMLSALGLFLVSFVMGLWILFILFGFGCFLTLVLAAPICIVPAILAIRALPAGSAEQPSGKSPLYDTQIFVPGRSPLYDAAHEGKLDVVQELVELGADVNEETGNESVLEVAVEGGHFEMVCFLVAHGAKIHHSVLGRSQIRRARYLKHDDIAHFLQAELAKPSRTAGGM